MRLLLLPILLTTSAAHPSENIVIPDDVLDGFKHINASAIVQELLYGHPKINASYGKIVTLCRFIYCHGEDLHDCADLCANTGPKFDGSVIEPRIRSWKSGRLPHADLLTCAKECLINCGKSDCTKECPVLCAIHHSYDNRREYESEFYELIIRLSNLDYPTK